LVRLIWDINGVFTRVFFDFAAPSWDVAAKTRNRQRFSVLKQEYEHLKQLDAGTWLNLYSTVATSTIVGMGLGAASGMGMEAAASRWSQGSNTIPILSNTKIAPSSYTMGTNSNKFINASYNPSDVNAQIALSQRARALQKAPEFRESRIRYSAGEQLSNTPLCLETGALRGGGEALVFQFPSRSSRSYQFAATGDPGRIAYRHRYVDPEHVRFSQSSVNDVRVMTDKGHARSNFNISSVEHFISSSKLSSTSQAIVPKGYHYRDAKPDPGALLKTKMRALENAQKEAVKIQEFIDGRIRYYTAEKPQRTPGPTRGRSHVTEWNPNTGQVRAWSECYDQTGNVNRINPKMIDGQTIDSQHYPPTKADFESFTRKPGGPR
jgi:hypothetical protein